MSESARPAVPSVQPAEDLAFLRDLAESGRDAPFGGGDYLIVGGGWFARASLIVWAGAQGLFGLSLPSAHLVWLIAAVGSAGSLVYLIRRDRGLPQTTTNRALGAVWSALGWGIFAFWLGSFVLAERSGAESIGPVLSTIALHVLSAYGVAWAAYRLISRQAWAGWVAAASFIAVPLMAAAQGTGHEGLVYALVIVATAVLPGLRLRA
ncbi:MAG: hypothetical protein ACKO7G_09560, partial [Gammaproteobacteria bacterium]